VRSSNAPLGLTAGPAPADARYLLPRAGPGSWNHVRPLRGGREVFPAMLECIAKAQRDVCLEMYILRDDRIGQRVLEQLIERARSGVAVRVMVDAVGSYALSRSAIEELRSAGAELVVFRPVMPWRPRFGWNQRDHRKLLIVDQRIAITGGINIGDEYCALEDGGGGWHDVCAQIEGPALRELLAIFTSTWRGAGGTAFAIHADAGHADAQGATWVQVIANRGRITRPRMRRALRRAIDASERSVEVLSAYFIPDRALRRSLARAVRRGVRVRVLVPARSDLRVVQYASRHLYARLLRDGVRVFEWQGAMMHAKCATIDGVWSTVGSYNLDRRSFIHNLEVGLLMVDRELASELERGFALDLARSREVDAEAWSRRSRADKWIESFCFLFRYWL
jgi:cardiolipin synthase